MTLCCAGSRIRIFGDPMQMIYSDRVKLKRDQDRWNNLKAQGKFVSLGMPHRWMNTNLELGKWILNCRAQLKSGNKINLKGLNLSGLTILKADNKSMKRQGFQFDRDQKKEIDAKINSFNKFLMLASTNETVRDMNASFFRRIPIWEGHTREPLSKLVKCLSDNIGLPLSIAQGLLEFLYEISVGFTLSSHGQRFIEEITTDCKKKASKKPLLIQNLAKYLIAEPNHKGASKLLGELDRYITHNLAGFDCVKIDLKREFWDALRLGDFDCVIEAEKALQSRRTHHTLHLPPKCISTIHKAKGLEGDNAIIVACDGRHFKDSEKARNILYVALSRAKSNLVIVVSDENPSPLFTID